MLVCDRWSKSVRTECLDLLIIFSEDHLRTAGGGTVNAAQFAAAGSLVQTPCLWPSNGGDEP